QQDGRAQILGKIGDRAVDRLTYLVRQRQAFGRVQLSELRERLILLGVLQVHVELSRTSSSGDKIVLGGIDRNTVQPGVDRAITAELGRCSVGLQKRF